MHFSTIIQSVHKKKSSKKNLKLYKYRQKEVNTDICQ